MPNTILSYHVFQAKTKARASEVNTNFSNYRGTLIPIDPNTAAAAGNTYDLGSTEYRWNVSYVNTLNLRGATSTSNFFMTCDSTSSQIAYLGFGSSNVMAIGSAGIRSGRAISADTTASFAHTTGLTEFMRDTVTCFNPNSHVEGEIHFAKGSGLITDATMSYLYFTGTGGFLEDLPGQIVVYRNLETSTHLVFSRGFNASNDIYVRFYDRNPLDGSSNNSATYIFKYRMLFSTAGGATFQARQIYSVIKELPYGV